MYDIKKWRHILNWTQLKHISDDDLDAILYVSNRCNYDWWN